MRGQWILFLGMAVCGPLQVCPASPTAGSAELFLHGNEAFVAGDYEAAVANYEAVLLRGDQSPELYHNLAEAHARRDQKGHAILFYERSLLLDPLQPEVRARLAELRRELAVPPLREGPIVAMVNILSVNHWTVLASLLFWTGMAFLLLPPLLAKPRKPLWWTGCTLLLFAVLSTAAVHQRLQEGNYALVLYPETSLKIAPTSRSPVALPLRAGTPLKPLRYERNHFLVETRNGRQGWIHHSGVGLLSPRHQQIPPDPPVPAEAIETRSAPDPGIS